MSRPLVLIVLILSMTSARAEWTFVGRSESSGGYKIYVDLSTIRPVGNLVKVWELYDYKEMRTVAGISSLSSKVYRQYDCQENELRVLFGSEFSKNLGDGNVVWSGKNNDPEWVPVEPESVGEKILKIVCDKKRETDEAKHKAEAVAQPVQPKLIDNWKARIMAKIRNRVVVPPNMEGNPQAWFDLVLLPGGEVLNATLRKSSGNQAFNAAVERAIMAAQPLPVPSDTDLFQENFRELNLVFRPKD